MKQLKRRRLCRPYVIINCAMSADGKIAMPSRKQTRISSEEDIARVHRLRNSCDAILVGIGTVLSDDPKLTVKPKHLAPGETARKPLRVILDSNCRIPDCALVLNCEAPTLVFCAKGKKREIKGAEVEECGSGNGSVGIRVSGFGSRDSRIADEDEVCLAKVLSSLARRGVRRLMVEGGETVVWSFLRHGFFDEFNVYVGSMVIGGKGPTPAGGEGAALEKEIIKLNLLSMEMVGNGVLLRYVKKGAEAGAQLPQ